MNTNHTIGPWSFDEYLNIVGRDGQIVKVEGVCLSSSDVARANARLIAAAPDLLEALQLIVRGYGVSFQDAALKTIVKEAIAKAKGEPS